MRADRCFASVSVYVVVAVAASTATAQELIRADFNDQPAGPVAEQPSGAALPMRLPNSVIRDSDAARADVVDAVGDLTDKPLLLDAPLDELAGVAFGPQGIGNPFETGRFVARWQSLVTGIPHPDERVHVGLTGRDRGLPSVWRLIYRPSGFLSVADASGERPLPVPFTPGRADQFEIAFDLDTDTYAFSVNGAAPFVGSLDAPGNFAHIIFRSLGRFGFEPVGLALDNVTLVRVPEPAGLGCLAVAGAALMGRRARRRR